MLPLAQLAMSGGVSILLVTLPFPKLAMLLGDAVFHLEAPLGLIFGALHLELARVAIEVPDLLMDVADQLGVDPSLLLALELPLLDQLVEPLLFYIRAQDLIEEIVDQDGGRFSDAVAADADVEQPVTSLEDVDR